MVLPLRDFGESSRSSENVMLMPEMLGITRCGIGKINIITTAVSSQRGKTCFLLFLHLSKHIQQMFVYCVVVHNALSYGGKGTTYRIQLYLISSLELAEITIVKLG